MKVTTKLVLLLPFSSPSFWIVFSRLFPFLFTQGTLSCSGPFTVERHRRKQQRLWSWQSGFSVFIGSMRASPLYQPCEFSPTFVCSNCDLLSLLESWKMIAGRLWDHFWCQGYHRKPVSCGILLYLLNLFIGVELMAWRLKVLPTLLEDLG